MPFDTLFAVSFQIGQGGDGCSSSAMNRISGDARRLFDPRLSSPFGMQMRNVGNAGIAEYDPTGKGGGTATFGVIFERVFARIRKYPTSGTPILWALRGSIEGAPALTLRLTTGGSLQFYNQGAGPNPGELLGSANFALNQWYCVEVYAKFNALPWPNNDGYTKLKVDDAVVVDANRVGVLPRYGIDKSNPNQKAIQSYLSDGVNAGSGLEVDYADWIADAADWVGLARRVSLLRATGPGAHSAWTGGSPDWRHQLDFPFPASGVTFGVSTPTAGASQTYSVGSPASIGVTGTIYSVRIAVFFATVGGGNMRLILRRNGVESLFDVGTPAQGAWSTWRVSGVGMSPNDTFEVGVKNSTSPSATTRVDACALLVEHDTPANPGFQPDPSFRVLQTAYTGNGTQQTINLSAVDPALATLVPTVVFVFPESGAQAGAWWWDSKVYPSVCNDAAALSYGILPNQGLVHITGAAGATNQNAIPYRLIACFDQSERIIQRGAVALAASTNDRDVKFRNSSFIPEALFAARESSAANDPTKVFYRGPGLVGDLTVSLGANISPVVDALQALQIGGFQVGTLVNEAIQDFGFMGWRTSLFNGPPLVAVASYVGNGSNPRSIALNLGGGTPAFALVVPTNSGKRWLRYGTVTRQFDGGTTGSANAITAFGVDSLAVGSELNANGVTYSVFALAAGVDEGAVLQKVSFDGGWGLCDDNGTDYGEPQWQVSPEREYPYLMSAGATLRIKKAEILIPGHLPGSTYRFRGFGSGGIDIPSTIATQQGSSDSFEITNVGASTALPSGTTAFYDPFDITWEVSRDGGASWQQAGVSKTPLYVGLSATGPNTATLYRTVVHLACSNAGATNQAQAASRTWELFSTGSGPTDVKTWDEQRLFYYEPLTSFNDNPELGCNGINPLLSARTGECSTWAMLLRDAWSVNGIDSVYILARRSDTKRFLVGDWDDLSTVRPFWFQTSIPDMIPSPPGAGGDPQPFGYYDDPFDRRNFLNKNTVKGQGTVAPYDGAAQCPSQKVFGNHQFLEYDGTYYDPSYGITYSGPTDFQSRLTGYGTDISGTNFKLDFTAFSALAIQFLSIFPVATVASATSATVFTLGAGQGAWFVVGFNVEVRRAANDQKREFRTIAAISGDTITLNSALGGTPVSGDTARRSC